MKFIVLFCIIFNLLAIILSKTIRTKSNLKSKENSQAKNKGFYYRYPYYGRRWYSGYYYPYSYYTYPLRRPLVISANLPIPMSQFLECPKRKGEKLLLGSSKGVCKVPPCTKKSCIQTPNECCIYGFPERN